MTIRYTNSLSLSSYHLSTLHPVGDRKLTLAENIWSLSWVGHWSQC